MHNDSDEKNEKVVPHLFDEPIRLCGRVVKGFGRGSKLLGFPTANLEPSAFKDVLDDAESGVYFGWAQVGEDEVRKTVLSIGYNPYFKNKVRTVEAYIIHEFDDDFYNSTLRLLICGSIRPQKNFDSMDALVSAIRDDVSVGSEKLDESPELRRDKLFLLDSAAKKEDMI